MQICLSHKSTVRFLDEAAEGYDEKCWTGKSRYWREQLMLVTSCASVSSSELCEMRDDKRRKQATVTMNPA